ncbi:MAG TPA: acetyl-CoA carboxylase biotin carboxylase subunit [Chloroflexota bacterium]|nr:acetyl-CoA carboxylase biotin carboxylase subunit [Chloroflexota bacterium]
MAHNFRKILVANRGEIAVRIVRACRELGIRSVAVYSDADVDSLPVRLADEAHYLGPAPARESYLNVERLLAVARRAGARAVHPGYGFLAENADFAAACAAAGLVFIGPRPETMRALGRKTDARRAMRAAGVPTVPGTVDPVADAAEARAAADAVGYPIALKAVAGGGGRGMRRVDDPAQLAEALRGAQSEALGAFGDASVYVERLIERPRHVEVQILADGHGSVVALGERDCSIQRRYQKLIEESPAPGLAPATRAGLLDAAVQAARAAGYVNAGTVEFILAPDGAYYFLEVNARLQVEHPVTELCTGIDIVKAQIAIAAGERLPWRQEDVQSRGAALECRIYAEDALGGFVPSSGPLQAVRVPEGPGVRLDAGYAAGDVVPVYYDSLIAKLCAWDADRAAAIARMQRALAECAYLGVRNTIGFHRYVLAHPEFVEARHDTGFVGRHWPPPEIIPEAVARDMALAAALARYHRARAPRPDDGARDGWAARGRLAATNRGLL